MIRVVYVAGKFRGDNSWQIEQNIRRAEETGICVARLGASPLIPHSNTRFFHGEIPESFMAPATLALLERCDALITVDNWRDSEGAMREVDTALRLNIPVFHELTELEGWLRHNG